MAIVSLNNDENALYSNKRKGHMKNKKFNCVEDRKSTPDGRNIRQGQHQS